MKTPFNNARKPNRGSPLVGVARTVARIPLLSKDLNSLDSSDPIIRWLELIQKAPDPNRWGNIMFGIRFIPPSTQLNRARQSVAATYSHRFDWVQVRATDLTGVSCNFKLIGPMERGSRRFSVIVQILAITMAGEVSMLRRCRVCGRWFHARQDRQFYDGKACRQKSYQSADAIRKRRNAARRQRYQREKELDRRVLEAARSGKG